MSLREYYCYETKKSHYVFEGEEKRLPNGENWQNHYRKMPPNPMVVRSTIDYMVDIPMLDSMNGLHDLDRVLTLEAENDRVLNEMEKMRINA
jgi:hypothetical protein